MDQDKNSHNSLKVLAFDVFGTVVDWHSSIAHEIDTLKLGVPGHEFANAWRKGYAPAMAQVRSGKLPWTKIDDLHRIILNQVLEQYDISSLNEEEKRHLNLVWHRLNPWPDTVEGLKRLKEKFTIVTLSNGNLSLLSHMAKRAQLPWDCILSAEIFHHYKPDPQTYLGVCKIFDIEPKQMMLVAAHEDDLLASKACQTQTAYIHRPLEFGPFVPKPIEDLSRFDYEALDLIDLAQQLHC